MKLAAPLVRLGRRVDAAALSEALAGFGACEWLPATAGPLGDSVIPLVSVGGTPNHDYAIAGPAKATPALDRSPGLREALATLGVPVARCRLVRRVAGGPARAGVDWSCHAFRHVTVCIPVVAGPGTTLRGGDASAPLEPGAVWLLDPSRPHVLEHPAGAAAVLLLVDARELPGDEAPAAPSFSVAPYRFEVATPEELAALTDEILADLARRGASAATVAAATTTVHAIRARWATAFRRFGHDAAGELAYRDVLLDVAEHLRPQLGGAGAEAMSILETMLLPAPPSPRRLHRPAAPAAWSTEAPAARPRLDRPVFIVSAPRSGSTLLFDLLARSPGAWTVGGESHAVLRAVPELHPAHRGYRSDRLTTADATPAAVRALTEGLTDRLVDREGRSWSETGPAAGEPAPLRMVEKTPANALRIPFLGAAFPDARFVWLRRDPRETVASLVEGWRSRRFLAYPGLPGWPYRDWSFLLPPGWAALEGRSILEISAHQWEAATTAIAADLAALPRARWCEVRYEELVARPRATLATVAAFAELPWDAAMDEVVAGPLAPSRVTLSAPAPGKWRRHEAELERLFPSVRAAPPAPPVPP